MDLSSINWIAVLVSALLFYGIGAIWYSFLFQKAWMKEVNVTMEDAKKANMVKIMSFTLIITIVMVTGLALFLAQFQDVDSFRGGMVGLHCGFAVSSMTIALNALYEMKSWKYVLINSGYMIVGFTISGFILGAWK
jgi:hypothetical protein